MKKIIYIILFTAGYSTAQPIILNGSIYENEFTRENKISGIISFMNLSDENLIVVVKFDDNPENNKEFLRGPGFGRQLKVYKGVYEQDENIIYGNYSILFYYSKSGNLNDKTTLLVQYNNHPNKESDLRGLGITFHELDDDSNGDFFEIDVELKPLYSQNETETRKVYLRK
ncbi:MAG: hypothetical protein PHW27_01040 [Melioribacteraceae bacterium]|nr:hypothetical protein [Melioribacteraceae bacterium]